MNELRCKVLVIGGGPGGYVAAIRAGQLGLDTILVEAERLGGTCLNVGCIPSKALIHAAGVAHGLHEPRTLGAIGLSVGTPKLDFARTIAWKDSIVTRLTNGVGALLKKAKVRTLFGAATIVDGKTVTVQADTGETRIAAEHLVLATGSEPVDLPELPFGGGHPVVDRVAGADRVAAIARGGRRRLYRNGARHGLRQARVQRDDRRGAAENPAALRCRADAAGRAALGG